VQTDAEGNYTATNLPPGDYVGTATGNGFSATAQKVTIFVAQTRMANATL
jgi:Carboxypeptidase regulatory-like domain